MTLATRIGVMNAGEIVQVGEPPEVYESPSTRFVADFVGSVNMLEGRVDEDEPDYVRIAVPAVDGTIHVGHGVSCTPNQKVWFAVRPEKLHLTRARPDCRNAFPVMVEDMAYVGNLSVYRLKLQSGTYLRATKSNVSRHEDDPISWDETAWVSWDDTAGVVLQQ